MRVLITGDRKYKSKNMVTTILDGLFETYGNNLYVIEGGAKGADQFADEWCQAKWPMKDFRNHWQCSADWESYGKAAGPMRNQKMLVEGKPEIVFAFHDDIENSKGTKDMVKRAKDASIPVFIIKKV